MIEDLHVLYRPQTLDEIIGQDHIVQSLKHLKEKNIWPHAYLFTGHSGCGKTTFGRIIAKELKCEFANLIEIDAASHSSVEDIRALTSTLNYTGFGKNPTKVIIIDEVHAISSKAWQALLKSIEEPPEHVYFILCTTEEDKVPKTIKTRCHQYNVRPVSYEILAELVELVAEDSNIEITSRMATFIAQEAEGSPRQALTFLSKASGVKSMEELRDILESTDENATVIELCRMLVGKGLTWNKVIRTLKEIESMPAESIRLTVLNYTAKALANTTDVNKALKFLAIIEVFSGHWNPSEKKAPLLLALGTLIFGDEE